MKNFIEFDEHLCKILEEISLVDKNDFYKNLLKNSPEETNSDEDYQEFKSKISALSRYPIYPSFKTLSKNLFHWILDKQLPFYVIENENLKGLSCGFSQLFQVHSSSLRELVLSEEFTQTQLFLLMKKATKQDILKLLGFSRTIGSLDLLPPDLYFLWTSYQTLHHPKSKLTVGARALTKHCHRSKDNWWGVCTGSEETKNKQAVKILMKIMTAINWLNIHMLPHDVYVLEVRCNDGYGLRWTHDGLHFRGFLEPQMLDGHERRWNH